MISASAMDVLRHSPLFAGFTEEQLEMVPKVCIPHTYAAGDTIVEEGEQTHSMWLVVEGAAQVVVGGAVVAEHGTGAHFGELALLTGEPRSASVAAKTPLTALEISRRQLEGLIASEPSVAFAIMGELADRLRRSTRALSAAIDAEPGVVAAIEAEGVSITRRDAIEVLGPIEYALQLGVI